MFGGVHSRQYKIPPERKPFSYRWGFFLMSLSQMWYGACDVTVSEQEHDGGNDASRP